jgi:hypothetical protein
VSNDNNVVPEISTTENPDAPVSLKAWHRPVVSRIEIAQTLHGATSTTDGDNGFSLS